MDIWNFKQQLSSIIANAPLKQEFVRELSELIQSVDFSKQQVKKHVYNISKQDYIIYEMLGYSVPFNLESFPSCHHASALFKTAMIYKTGNAFYVFEYILNNIYDDSASEDILIDLKELIDGYFAE